MRGCDLLWCPEGEWFGSISYEKTSAPSKYDIAPLEDALAVTPRKEIRYGSHHRFHYNRLVNNLVAA